MRRYATFLCSSPPSNSSRSGIIVIYAVIAYLSVRYRPDRQNPPGGDLQPIEHTTNTAEAQTR
jgi:hypothetical protein